MEKLFFIFYDERKIQNLKFKRKILIYKSKSLLIGAVFCRVTTIILVMISLCYNTYKDNIPVQNLFDQFAKKLKIPRKFISNFLVKNFLTKLYINC